MNVNEKLLKLKEVTGLNVRPDIRTESDGENYIIFTYAAEHVEIAADDAPIADTATIYVSLYTEPGFNFMAVKEQIKGYLESLDYCTITDVRTFMEEYRTNANSVKYKRHTIFEIEITEWRV